MPREYAAVFEKDDEADNIPKVITLDDHEPQAVELSRYCPFKGKIGVHVPSPYRYLKRSGGEFFSIPKDVLKQMVAHTRTSLDVDGNPLNEIGGILYATKEGKKLEVRGYFREEPTDDVAVIYVEEELASSGHQMKIKESTLDAVREMVDTLEFDEKKADTLIFYHTHAHPDSALELSNDDLVAFMKYGIEYAIVGKPIHEPGITELLLQGLKVDDLDTDEMAIFVND